MYDGLAKPSYTNASRVINEGPTLFFGCVFAVTVDGQSVELYDGLDTQSGVKRFHVKGWAADNNRVNFSRPVLFDRGLYVSLGTGVSDVTVIWCDYSEPVADYLAKLAAMA